MSVTGDWPVYCVLNEISFVVDNENIILDICWNNKKLQSCILTAGFRPNQNADRRSGFVPSLSFPSHGLE